MKKVVFVEKYGQGAYERHLELCRERSRKHYYDNRESECERASTYRQTTAGQDVKKRGQAKYRQTPGGKVVHNRGSRKYFKTAAGKVTANKHNAKRRGLGRTPLNEPFAGCEGHHIDKKTVIHIPKVLHRSVSHCLETGRGMAEINGFAFVYLFINQLQSQVL